MKQIIRYPLVTEKSSSVQATNNQYVFIVDPSANKFEIKKEVEALKKGIEVVSVRTVNVRGKVKRMGHSMGKKSNWKKALVRLKTGQTLELFEAAV
jgi:large subunit ribosomal protein L23